MGNNKTALIWGVVVLLIIIIGVVLFTGADEDTDLPVGEETTEEDMAAGGTHPSLDTIMERSPQITLEDVGNTGAEGTAGLAFAEPRTFHMVTAQNMPALEGSDFYEGWLVKDAAAGELISTGRMDYNADTQTATLGFIEEGDYTDYRRVVITLEPDDGDPAPAPTHILDGTFSADTDLIVE